LKGNTTDEALAAQLESEGGGGGTGGIRGVGGNRGHPLGGRGGGRRGKEDGGEGTYLGGGNACLSVEALV